MRIFSQDLDLTLEEVSLFMNAAELAQLRDSADNLLRDQELEHCHICNEDFQIEVTLVDIDRDISEFNERAQRVIRDNK
ncbi:MAG: hypothetical protein WAO58_04155 [Fimbriimonadaceae bacterium]